MAVENTVTHAVPHSSTNHPVLSEADLVQEYIKCVNDRSDLIKQLESSKVTEKLCIATDSLLQGPSIRKQDGTVEEFWTKWHRDLRIEELMRLGICTKVIYK